jgi:metallo-beta-lactamase family protein
MDLAVVFTQRLPQPSSASTCLPTPRIFKKRCAFIAKRNARRRAIEVTDPNTPVPPLYTVADAENTAKHFAPRGLHEKKTIDDGLQIEFSNAGQILGSAFVLLESVRNGCTVRILFSGDLGRPGVPILRDPDPAPEADYLILESTYGDRLHQPLGKIEDKLLRLVGKTIARGGPRAGSPVVEGVSSIAASSSDST